ncbi:hypothetical protein NP493_226g08036 [Ridgeia piscesae]|uniref:Amiloride-sensitive sodium channel n=1 Tax=Ridgeia piscesae TaxID=27915 RepID=A0AAD9P093_RIDPI|nr:hypothetical protein NP493_226g08036 [Ridgeia piscesae]
MKTCFQRHLMEKCGCYSTQFPVGRNSTAYAGINVHALRPCEDDTQEGIAEYLSCAEEMKMLYQTDQIRCSDECPHTCSEVHYDYSISQSAWPSIIKQNAVLNELYWRSAYLWSTLDLLNGIEQSEFISNNVLVVEVYFETFQYEELRTEPSYQMTDLLSDIGGQGGLWLGISVVAMCELIELLIDFIVLMLMRLQMARKTRVGSPVLPLQLRQ